MKKASRILMEAPPERQATDAFFRHCGGRVVKYCAVGCLLYDAGHTCMDGVDLRHVLGRFGLRGTRVECPLCGGGRSSGDVLSTMSHLNDHHRQTFRQIGEWLREMGH